MMNFSSPIFRAGLPAAGPALVLFLVGTSLFSPFVEAQTRTGSRVSDSILGVRIGTSLEDAEKKLERLSITGEHPIAADDDEREGGNKRAWRLKGTGYTSVALQTDEKGRVVWVTGFVRPSKELLFSELGDTTRAVRATDTQAIWNVSTPKGGYRLVAKGENGRARVIYMISLATPAK